MIVAAVIIAAGLICCAIGSSAAKKEGFMLFPQTENGESVYTYDFTGRDINRITVDSADAKITLRSGGERSYIEIRNYNANYYRLNEENRAISFAEIDDVLSMFKFWEGFTFKGMRYVFASGTNRDEAHEIIVNVAESENVGSVVLRPKSGGVTVDGYEGEGDLTVTVGSGTVTLSSVHVSGSVVASLSSGELSAEDLSAVSINLSTDDSVVSVKDVKCEKLTWTGASRTFFADSIEATDISATSTDASVTVTGVTFKSVKIETESGPVRLDLADPLSAYATDLSTQTSSIFMNGEKYDGYQYKTVPETKKTDADDDGDADSDGDKTDDADKTEENSGDKASYSSVLIHTVNGTIDVNSAPEPETEG